MGVAKHSICALKSHQLNVHGLFVIFEFSCIKYLSHMHIYSFGFSLLGVRNESGYSCQSQWGKQRGKWADLGLGCYESIIMQTLFCFVNLHFGFFFALRATSMHILVSVLLTWQQLSGGLCFTVRLSCGQVWDKERLRKLYGSLMWKPIKFFHKEFKIRKT